MKYHFNRVYELKPGGWQIPFTTEPDKDPELAGAKPIDGSYYFFYDEVENYFKVMSDGFGEIIGLKVCLFWRALRGHAKAIGLGFLDLGDVDGFEPQALFRLFYLFKQAGDKGFSPDRIRELRNGFEMYTTGYDCPADAACEWLLNY